MSSLQTKSFPSSLLRFSLVMFPHVPERTVKLLTNSSTCFWRSRCRAKRGTISMRSLLSSCKRMQSHKPSEEGIHLNSCLSSTSLSSYFCTLDVCTSSNGAVSETMVTSQTMDWSFSHATGSGILRFHHQLFSAQLWWCSLSWSASFPTGGQGCYAALFSLLPLGKPGRCDPGIQSTTPGITISVYLWMIPGDPEIVWEDSDFDALYVLAWRHPGTTVHYPITNSCPMGKRLKSVYINRVMQTLCSFLFQLFLSCGSFLTFQTFCIRKELRCYLSKHQTETHPHWTWTVPPLPTSYWF